VLQMFKVVTAQHSQLSEAPRSAHTPEKAERPVRGGGWLVHALTLAAALVANTASVGAQGPSSSEDRSSPLPFRLDAHAALDWESGFGAGARADIPIFGKDRMYNGRDELAISVGADVLFVSFTGSNKLLIWPTATIQWSLSVSERFVFYPELGMAAKVERHGWDGIYPNIGFGGRYYMVRSVALLGRLGWPMAVSAGATF
jgi:hypothetical protein